MGRTQVRDGGLSATLGHDVRARQAVCEVTHLSVPREGLTGPFTVRQRERQQARHGIDTERTLSQETTAHPA